MIRVCNFSSGSEGNCTYIEVNNGTRILIDAGISASIIVSRLKLLKVDPSTIDGIIISHEHSDHIKGLDVFASKYNIPIYAHQSLWPALNKKLTRILSIYKQVFYSQTFNIKDAIIDSVPVSHDASHTSAFKVSNGESGVAIITDLGIYDQNVLALAQKCQVVYIESNHDEEMLRTNPNYPFHLKKRILSSKGHLSNTQCAGAIETMARNGTKQFVLSHLSKHNNTPDKAFQTVCAILASKGIIESKHIKIDIASTEIGNIFKIV